MNAQRIRMPRIRIVHFAFLQIREQVKGGSKERVKVQLKGDADRW
jgi:hypothetical protein